MDFILFNASWAWEKVSCDSKNSGILNIQPQMCESFIKYHVSLFTFFLDLIVKSTKN